MSELEQTLLIRTYTLIETKVPHFLFKLERIRRSLAQKNSILFRDTDYTYVEVENLNVNLCIFIIKREDWEAQISLHKKGFILDISLEKKVIATELPNNYMEKINKKKDKKSVIGPYSFMIYVPIPLFIKYIPNIISSNSVHAVFTYLDSSTFDLIMDAAIDELTKIYIKSYEKIKKEHPGVEINTFESKYIHDTNKYVLTSDIWLPFVINRFSPEQLLLTARIFFYLFAIKRGIEDRANRNFETYRQSEIQKSQ